MIDYITALNGGIAVFENFHNELGWASDVNELADLLIKHGASYDVMGSSSMDFADEYGFDSRNGAVDLWVEAMGIYTEEMNNLQQEESYWQAMADGMR